MELNPVKPSLTAPECYDNIRIAIEMPTTARKIVNFSNELEWQSEIRKKKGVIFPGPIRRMSKFCHKEENSEAEMGKEKLFVETKGFPAEIQIFRFCPQ